MALPYKSPKKILAELLEKYMGYQRAIKNTLVCHTPYDSRHTACFPCSVMNTLGIVNEVNPSYAIFGDTHDMILTGTQLIRMDIPEERLQKILMSCDNTVDSLNAVIQAIVLSNQEAKTQYMDGMMRVFIDTGGNGKVLQPIAMTYSMDSGIQRFTCVVEDNAYLSCLSSDGPLTTHPK